MPPDETRYRCRHSSRDERTDGNSNKHGRGTHTIRSNVKRREAHTCTQVTRERARLSTSSRPSSLSAPEHRYYPPSHLRSRPFAIEGCQCPSPLRTALEGLDGLGDETSRASCSWPRKTGGPDFMTAREWYVIRTPGTILDEVPRCTAARLLRRVGETITTRPAP